MNKEEQITEIANSMADTMAKNFGLRYKDFAEKIYDLGYRKTFTSDFSSDTQKAYKEGYDKGCETSAQAWDNGYNDGYESGQEETAKEILVKLMASTTPTFDKDGKPIMQITADFALNLCKKYDIKYEVDENE